MNGSILFKKSIFKFDNTWKYKFLFNLQNLFLDNVFTYQEFVFYFMHCNLKAAVALDGVSIAVLRFIFYA